MPIYWNHVFRFSVGLRRVHIRSNRKPFCSEENLSAAKKIEWFGHQTNWACAWKLNDKTYSALLLSENRESTKVKSISISTSTFSWKSFADACRLAKSSYLVFLVGFFGNNRNHINEWLLPQPFLNKLNYTQKAICRRMSTWNMSGFGVWFCVHVLPIIDACFLYQQSQFLSPNNNMIDIVYRLFNLFLTKQQVSTYLFCGKSIKRFSFKDMYLPLNTYGQFLW